MNQKKIDSLENKYLSKVTVSKDGVILTEVRGSTLPDSAAFYLLWHNSGEIVSPSDSDVSYIYKDSISDQSLIDTLENVALIPSDFLSFMYEFVAKTPVLYSGLYKFEIGLHNNGNSVHGKPSVPRLMGGDEPFSGKTGYTENNWKSQVKDGGLIETITLNKVQGGYWADGINIHDGRWSGSHRDSAGCLTIDPRDWEKFYEQLPNIQAWSEGTDEGYVVIVRKGERDL